VTDIRNLGLAGALQLEPIADQPGRRAYEIAMRCWRAGAYVRAAGETIQLAPPFIADEAFIDEVVGILDDALRADAANG
jgi:beta-alanine--pyruvate transaminase